MKLSVGNDIVENSRIEETYKKFGKKFLEKIYTGVEIEYCLSKSNPVPYLSGRFACKEAFIKAIGLPNNKSLNFKEIELSGNFFGKKQLVLYGKALELFKMSEYNDFSVSISHSDNYSTAIVILFKNENG